MVNKVTNFGTYTGEILKAEGFNEFIPDSLTDNKITPACLTRFGIVILSETAITKVPMNWIICS
jgi:hypothetical protein